MSFTPSWNSARQVLRTCAALCLLAPAVWGQHVVPWHSTFWSDDFASPRPGDYTVGIGSSYDAAERSFTLTRDTLWQSGRLFLMKPRVMDFFDASWRAWFGVRGVPPGNIGADGIVFAFCPSATYPATSGYQLDFDGCGGLGFECDTYYNVEAGDPSEEHFAIIRNVTADHIHSETTAPGTLKNGAWHTIRFINENGVFTAIIDGQGRLNWTIAGYAAATGYFGFTAATGNAYNRHAIDDVRVEVPTDRASTLGSMNLCERTVLDTAIAVFNNRPAEAIELDSVHLDELAGTAEFTLGSITLPLRVEAGSRAILPLRFTTTRAGLRRAVLRVTAVTGETVRDTLLLDCILPQAVWAPAGIDFPRIHAGRSAVMSAVLANTGTLPLTLDSAHLASPVFTLIAPTGFPITLAPGEQREFQFRFSPVAAGDFSTSCVFPNACGGPAGLSLRGTGYVEALRFAFPSPLMLLPGVPGATALRVYGGPNESILAGFTTTIVYDPRVARFVSATTAGSDLPANSTLTTTETGPGRIALSVAMPTSMTSPGALGLLTFAPVIADTGCTALAIDSMRLNPSGPAVGTPEFTLEAGRICINPSCRVPEGVVRIADPARLSVAPNPADGAVTITATLARAGRIRITVFNARGEMNAVVTDEVYDAGAHAFRYDAGTLPAGTMFVRMDTFPGACTTAFIITR